MTLLIESPTHHPSSPIHLHHIINPHTNKTSHIYNRFLNFVHIYLSLLICLLFCFVVFFLPIFLYPTCLFIPVYFSPSISPTSLYTYFTGLFCPAYMHLSPDMEPHSSYEFHYCPPSPFLCLPTCRRQWTTFEVKFSSFITKLLLRHLGFSLS